MSEESQARQFAIAEAWDTYRRNDPYFSPGRVRFLEDVVRLLLSEGMRAEEIRATVEQVIDAERD